MKRNIFFAIVFFATTCFPPLGGERGACQGIGINSNNTAPDSSAGLDIDFTDKGLLIPRLTTAQRDAIATPANSLLIYNATTGCFEAYSLANGWVKIGCFGCVNVPATPDTITGTPVVCQSQAGAAYSIPLITGATGYMWFYTGAGFTIVTGAGTNSITADFSATATSGTLIVYGTNTCGNGAPSPSYSVTVNDSVPTATASASPNPICTQQALTLTGSATGATAWNWTGPNGFTSSSQNPVIPNITTAAAGVYILVASNACGPAPPVATDSVIVDNIYATGTDTFYYTGALQTFTVPPCVDSVTIEALGAQGGICDISDTALSRGGKAIATVPVTAGEILNIYVGGAGTFGTGGWNGGGSAVAPNSGGGGGGASDIRQGGIALTNRIIVAGGGGGNGGGSCSGLGKGGHGGDTTGVNGTNSTSGCVGGTGGTQSAGGIGGAGCNPPPPPVGGSPGSLGYGGAGGGSCGGGGGGGGGYWGGGGGGSDVIGCYGAGGGGGSGYVTGTNTSMAPGVRAGNGQVIISW